MTDTNPVIGVLALQGDYQKHRAILQSIAVSSREVREAGDFQKIDRLIIPGGESTVIVELLKRLQLEQVFASFIRSHPIWGTCAGMVLLASRVNDGSIAPYNNIDIALDRNGYGRQFFSKVVPSEITLNGRREKLDLVFIRAPRVTKVGKEVTVLLTCENDPVMLSQGHILVSAFHPELTNSVFLHNYFAREFVRK